MSLGAQHGYGVLLRIEQITGGAMAIEQGALHPARTAIFSLITAVVRGLLPVQRPAELARVLHDPASDGILE